MAHLSIEYSANLGNTLDMSAFCEVARRAMAETGIFPLAGIRVRAIACDHTAIGDGSDGLAFAAMIMRMGKGRSEAARLAALEAVYAAVENWCKGRVNLPFALSLEILEINAPFAEKRLNTIRPALQAKGIENV
ncbi:MAG: 5-carboxymethyl-2-hydroxymuconate isomerase [Rhodobacteraceae bacterium]|nr:5-carboxymethyl-2-hydroxymuconate isomerase [Paracoccaceae bacterium]